MAFKTVAVYMLISRVGDHAFLLMPLYVDASMFCILLVASSASLIPRFVEAKYVFPLFIPPLHFFSVHFGLRFMLFPFLYVIANIDRYRISSILICVVAICRALDAILTIVDARFEIRVCVLGLLVPCY